MRSSRRARCRSTCPIRTRAPPLESPLYGEPGLPVAGSWAWSRVVALFAADGDWRAALEAAAEALAVAVPPHETYPVAEQDWVRNTQAQFGPIEIAPGFWVVPSWSDVPDAAAVTLRLDPGLAFGTGSHPTTRLCLEWLRAELRDRETVLDYGCGSGILAIAAGKLGAGRVAGVDVDPQALRASEANARANGVGARFARPGRTCRGFVRHRRRQHPRQSADPAGPDTGGACRGPGTDRAVGHSRRSGGRGCRRLRAVV